MHTNGLRWLIAMFMACALFMGHALAQERGEAAPSNGKRVALVIGNSENKGMPLRNPVNDARDVAAKLKALGFEQM